MSDHVDLIRQMFGAKVTVTGRGRITEEHPARPGATSGATYGPEDFRRVAARCAQIADEAEGYIDPAEVEELTGAIAEALKGPVIDASADLNTSRIAARTALRWMRGREAQS